MGVARPPRLTPLPRTQLWQEIPHQMKRSIRSLRLLLSSAAFFVLLLLVLAAGYWFSLHQITFTINGKSYTTRLPSNTVAEAIESANLLVESADKVEPSPDAPISDGMTISIIKAAQIAVEVDGEIKRVYSHATNPLTILAEAQVVIGDSDEVWVDGVPLADYTFSIRSPRVIRVVRAFTVTIEDAGTPIEIITTAETVGGAIQTAQITLYTADEVTPPLETALEQDMQIQVTRSQPITVYMDGMAIETRSTGQTVQDVLIQLEIALSGLDYAIPQESAPLESVIRIVRVREDFEILDEILPFSIVMQPNSSLALDTHQVLYEGQEGLFRQRYRIRLEDGQEVSRVLQDSWVETVPVDAVVMYGTQIFPQIFYAPDGNNLEYWRVLEMQVGTYRAEQGRVAVDKSVIPLGTQVYIEGYGKAVASDELPDGSGLTIALGYYDSTLKAWNGTIQVYMLMPPPENIPYVFPIQETAP